VARYLGSLDRHHICKLQSVLGFERDSFHLPVPLRAVGVVRDFPDFGTEPAVFRSDDDFEHAIAPCPWAFMKLWPHMSGVAKLAFSCANIGSQNILVGADIIISVHERSSIPSI